MKKRPILSKRLIWISLIVAILAFTPILNSVRGQGITTYSIDGEDIKVQVSSFLEPTTFEDQIKEESGFYFFKLSYRDNFFSINLPQRIFEKLTEDQKKDLIRFIPGLYDRSFDAFKGNLGFSPKEYKFNVTFAKTQRGHPFNKVYLFNKTSNIFPDFLPYENDVNIVTPVQEWVMLHEIGHSLFAIAIGSIQDPKNKYMEEGFVDYFAEEVLAEGHTGRLAKGKVGITTAQADNIKGLSQLDVDVSLWGEEKVLNIVGMEGYPGITHHHFGLEFIKTFIDVFGTQDLREFLTRFKQTENTASEDDYGTDRIHRIFVKMGYSSEQISVFEKELHKRLKDNVFDIKK